VQSGENLRRGADADFAPPADDPQNPFGSPAKALDEGDKVLRQSVTFRIVQTLSIAAKRGRFVNGGKRKGVRVWRV
jgi:hypothetical protein